MSEKTELTHSILSVALSLRWAVLFTDDAWQEDAEAGSPLCDKEKGACRTRSLSSDFKQYLAQQGLHVTSDTSSLEVLCLSAVCKIQKVKKLL